MMETITVIEQVEIFDRGLVYLGWQGGTIFQVVDALSEKAERKFPYKNNIYEYVNMLLKYLKGEPLLLSYFNNSTIHSLEE